MQAHIWIVKLPADANLGSLPKTKLDIQLSAEGEQLVCHIVSRKWLLLTPEEEVRQSLLQMLILQAEYPPSLISTERQLLTGRYDVIVYDREGRPFLLCECKEPGSALDQNVLFQARRYQKELSSPYLLVTNGVETFCLDTRRFEWKFLGGIPKLGG